MAVSPVACLASYSTDLIDKDSFSSSQEMARPAISATDPRISRLLMDVSLLRVTNG
jgi:hypothetical protein